MKTIKCIIILAFSLLLLNVTAQNQITVNTVIKGKTVLEISKEHAVDACNETKSVYSESVTETTFVNECLKYVPNHYSDLKEVYKPYASFLFSLHKKGLSESQIRNLTTGKEFVDCVNNLISWKGEHPGENPDNMLGWLQQFIDFLKSGGTIWN